MLGIFIICCEVIRNKSERNSTYEKILCRPLLTRLVEQEVETETSEAERGFLDIDFSSDRVIQCQGELAKLDEDEVI